MNGPTSEIIMLGEMKGTHGGNSCAGEDTLTTYDKYLELVLGLTSNDDDGDPETTEDLGD